MPADHSAQDPKENGPKPTFPTQPQEHPGIESQMDPKPDYGEQSYRGSGRLEGKAAIVVLGARLRWRSRARVLMS